MADFAERLIEEALRSELGKTARFWYYGREHRTPMTFVLDEVERQIGSRFAVYWVDDGPPEIFCLPGFSPSPVVFSTRYLSLTAFIRHLFVDGFLREVLAEVSERATLKLIAEMALRYGDPDLAVLAFVKSVTGKGIFLDDSDQVTALELAPIGEAYMATWFYGLVHELGHLHPEQGRSYPEEHLFSDAEILREIRQALDHFKPYPDALKEEAMVRARQPGSPSVLGVERVRSEGLADMFAASLLLRTTLDIMKEGGGEPFAIVRYLHEMVVFLNVLALIDRCRRVAHLASSTVADREAQIEAALHPVAVTVRGSMLRKYLAMAVAAYITGEEPTGESIERAQRALDEVNEHYAERIVAVEKGTAQAMEFALFPERRDNDWALLEAFRKELPGSTPASLEARRFCGLAEALGVEGKLLRALQGIVADPSLPLRPDPRGDLMFFVPWVAGPDGFSRPFGLDTKHGHLVFVFLSQDELYDAFFQPSAESLKPGFTLQRALVPVPRRERLGPELAARMPEGQPFQIVIEGTESFERFLRELGDDTIWGDPAARDEEAPATAEAGRPEIP